MAAAKPLVLLTTADVHEAMSTDPDLLAQAQPAIDSAIIRATIRLRTTLGTSLAPLVNEDVFFLDPTIPMINGRYRCRLQNGILRSTPPVTVQWCWEVDGTYQDVQNPIVDAKRGVVQVPQYMDDNLSYYRRRSYGMGTMQDPLRELYIKIGYNSGLIKGEPVPEELKQALLCYVPQLILSVSSTTTASPKEMYAVQAKAKTLNDSADDMLLDYMRRTAPCAKPISHVDSPIQV